jgi:glycosyltransferase involved in cell wall biosynthesis
MHTPKVSICIPTYRQTEYLKRTLESIVLQNFQDFEIILTDDSPDNSVSDLIANFHFMGKLHYFKNTTRLGSPENWNESVRKASGQYIKMLHHDDWFTSPSSLSEYVKMLDEHPESDFAFSATSVFESDQNSYREYLPDADKLKELAKDPQVLFSGNCVGAPSATIYRRSLNLEYDPRIKYYVDIEFYMRLLSGNTSFQFNDNTLICTTSNAIHQVTEECQNKEVQLYEYTYIYNKLKRGFFPEKRIRNFYYALFYQYDITSLEEFRAAGSELPKPAFYFWWMLTKKKIKHMLFK